MNEFDEYEPRKPISKEERDAGKVLRDADAQSALIEHANAAEAFDKNRELGGYVVCFALLYSLIG
jgi:hypothetical protein